MANPNDPKPGKKPEKKPDAGNLPEWLRTDDWLQITPPPLQQSEVDPMQQSGPVSEDQATEMIELEDEVDVGNPPPSTMLFSDPDDSVVLMDDIQISGPLSGILAASSPSSIRLPVDPDQIAKDIIGPLSGAGPASAPPEVVPTGSDDSIDLTKLPGTEQLPPGLSGPPTSRTRLTKPLTTRTPIVPVSPEDVLGQAFPPTTPASGWLGGSATGLPRINSESVPELPPPNLTVPTPPKMDGSWHPSSGDVHAPSMVNIDLPPIGTSDVFSDSARMGQVKNDAALELPAAKQPAPPKLVTPSTAPPKVEPAKIEPPKPIASSGASTPGTWSTLPSTPSVPPAQPAGSWHPSSGNVTVGSYSDIDLPPEASSGGGQGIPKPNLGQAIPTPLEPFSLPDLAAIPLDVTPTTPGSGWLTGDSKVAAAKKPDDSTPSLMSPAATADIELPKEDVEPADIFSTAKRPDGSVIGGSALFSGAIAPDSNVFGDPASPLPGDSNLFADFSPTKPVLQSKPIAPQDANLSAVDLGKLLQEQQSSAVNFAIPKDSAGSSISKVEVIDTSGSLENPVSAMTEEVSETGSRLPDVNEIPEPKFGHDDDATLEEFLREELLAPEDDGKPDFDILSSGFQSDSNLLGDRTMVEDLLADNPQSSSVNLVDSEKFDLDSPMEPGAGSSIFHKYDLPQKTGVGRVDIDEIPLMGSSDEGTDAMFEASSSAVMGGRLATPGKPDSVGAPSDLEASVFEVDLPTNVLDDDSGKIDWAKEPDPLTDRLGNPQNTMQSTQRSAMPLEDDDRPSVVAVPRSKQQTTNRPAPAGRPTEDELPDEDNRPKGALLIAALGLLAGAGIGAGALFTFGGGTKVDPNLVAQVDTLRQQETKAREAAEALQKKVEAADQIAADAKKQAEDARTKLNTAVIAKNSVESNLATMRSEQAMAVSKARTEAEATAAKKFADDKKKLEEAVTKATAEAKQLMDAMTKTQKDLDEKTTELTTAKTAAETATSKLKTVDSLLDPIIEKMKIAKLIDEKADRAAAVKALPDAVKKANLVTGDGETAKLAADLAKSREELLATKKDADTKVKQAEEKLANAQKDTDKLLAEAKTASEKAMADLKAKAEGADKRVQDEVAKAVATAKKDSESMIANLKKEVADRAVETQKLLDLEKLARAADAKQFEAKAATLTEQFEKQLAAARTGVAIPLSTTASTKVVDAATAYDSGTTAYLAGRYADSEQFFAAAVKSDEFDARYWYFLGLSKYAQGRTTEAANDFKKGADLESRAKPGRRAVSTSLEAVQGVARQALEAVRP